MPSLGTHITELPNAIDFYRADLKNVVLRNNLAFGGGLKDDDDNGACQLKDNIADKDPRFVSPARRDFHLQSGSPAISAGIADLTPARDADGRARAKGKRPDLGAFAYR